MKKLFILLTVLLILGNACKKDFLNVDETNPNTASAVPVNLVLPAAINSIAAQVDRPRNYDFCYLWYGVWAISNGYVPPATLTEYNLLNSTYQVIWDNSYLTLQNLDYVEKASMTSKGNNFRAIAMIMKVYLYHNLVDAFGNVPYSQALKSSSAVLKPTYYNAQTIYEDLAVKIDTAINLIKNASIDADAPGTSDIIYQGDMGKWA